jgi:alanyl-tRNA synthetase
LIEIEALDLSACGGTHVARTGAIGIILASSWERFRGGTRVEFVCGSRALRDYRRLREAVAGAVRHLSVLPAELPEAVERLQIENREQRRRLNELQGRVAVQHAAELAAAAEPVGEIRLVAAALDGWDAASLKVVAAGVAGRPDHLAVLVAGPAPSTIVVARAANVTVDCAAVLRDVTAAFGGKGGGKADLAQGGGLTGTASDILAQARTAIRAACGTV